MNKNKLQLKSLILILLLLLLSGCVSENSRSEKLTLTYSNLADKSSQSEVRGAMEVARISKSNIDNFFMEVNIFNETVEYTSLVESGFTTINHLEPDYDLVKMIELWDAKYPKFIGYNCRLTTFDLIKDKIKINYPDPTKSDWLIFDKNSLDNNPKELFNKEEYNDFLAFYAYIPTVNSKDINVHLEKVKENIKNQGIEFLDQDQLSIISVIFYDEDGYLFVGHTGVLLKTLDNKLLFIEKLSYQIPYQALKFDNKLQLNDYLMNKYDISYNQDTARPFIMENGELIEGYRKN